MTIYILFIFYFIFLLSNLATVASNYRGHKMCAHLQTVCWGSLEVEQTCGVIPIDEGMHFDELRLLP